MCIDWPTYKKDFKIKPRMTPLFFPPLNLEFQQNTFLKNHRKHKAIKNSKSFTGILELKHAVQTSVRQHR